MEPVLVSLGVVEGPSRDARPDVAREATDPGPSAPVTDRGTATESRRGERLTVLSALGLAVVTSTLSFGFVLGGGGDRDTTGDRSIVAVWTAGRLDSGDEVSPAMGGSSASARHRCPPATILPPAGARAITSPRRVLRASYEGPPPSSPPRSAPPPAPDDRPIPLLREPNDTLTLPVVNPAPAPFPEPKRIRVRDARGDTVVARVHGGTGDDLHIMLPDGQLGMPDRPVFTPEPFRPATAEEAERELLDGPYAGFKSLRLAHYLIVYQSGDGFAQKSGQVLEKLYRGLAEAFRKFEVPVRDAEFPLVAVIFRTEAAFRARKQVDPEVQAYYEIYSNRIYFYETSERDEQAPEVAALRRPQTVAHEGTHQILQNIGIHPRLAPWPPWLIEGLAEYCATPVTTRKGVTNWSGLGMVNPAHLATIRDLDDPLSGQVAGALRPEHIGRKPGMPLVEYLVTKTDLTPTDYALSWAMTHYLAKKKTDSFVAYLRSMSQLAPLSKRTPAEQLDAFRRFFGKDLARLDREIGVYLGKLKVTNQLPYYAVIFQQRVGDGLMRRAAIVSQSPSMIRQWLETVTAPRGDTPVWEAQPFTHRTPALAAAEAWVRGQ